MDFKPLKNNHTGTILEVKDGEKPGYYAACNNCDVGAVPMWFKPDTHEAVGSCIMCGNKLRITLIEPGMVIKYIHGVGESIVPKK